MRMPSGRLRRRLSRPNRFSNSPAKASLTILRAVTAPPSPSPLPDRDGGEALRVLEAPPPRPVDGCDHLPDVWSATPCTHATSARCDARVAFAGRERERRSGGPSVARSCWGFQCGGRVMLSSGGASRWNDEGGLARSPTPPVFQRPFVGARPFESPIPTVSSCGRRVSRRFAP